jgi:5'(3')-deoxyribonucleotidase
MSKQIFLLDMDGVIADFVSSLIVSLGVENVSTHDDWTSWSYHQTIGITDEQMWKATHPDGWWLALKPYPWAHELVSMLKSRGQVIYCSSPSLKPNCASEKVQWLRNHGFMMESENAYSLGPHKELAARSGAILIDDSDSNYEKYVAAGGEAWLFPQPWNKNRHLSRNKLEFIASKWLS